MRVPDAGGQRAAIVLAGGRASRLGGADKAVVDVGGRMLVDHVYAAVDGCAPIVAVGPPSLARSGVTVVREDPPFGGPVAGLAAALGALASSVRHSAAVEPADPAPRALSIGDPGRHAASGPPRTARRAKVPIESAPPVLAPAVIASAAETWLLACDLPRARDIVALLGDVPIPPGADAVILADADGRAQWLAGRYRIDALRHAVAALPDVNGASMKRLLSGIRIHTVTDAAGAAVDLDTWDAIEHYRSERMPHD